ncbi:MAG: hypothetical protein A3K18_30200 [Lentisphaerae bacterium RIFOXYA12_64_32]|nr:MAG: hypothetical protein A3K18_30200 [Lentisphaerae bacterium RIFOXYA12_64_32]
MNFLDAFMPFRPKRGAPKRTSFDVDRALLVELHAHPSIEKHRAANGELILIVKRNLYPAEKFIARFFTVNPQRRIVLDKGGEFMLNEALKPNTRLADVAVKMSKEFNLDLEQAKLGVVQLVKELMLREFVFLVRK